MGKRILSGLVLALLASTLMCLPVTAGRPHVHGKRAPQRQGAPFRHTSSHSTHVHVRGPSVRETRKQIDEHNHHIFTKNHHKLGHHHHSKTAQSVVLKSNTRHSPHKKKRTTTTKKNVSKDKEAKHAKNGKPGTTTHFSLDPLLPFLRNSYDHWMKPSETEPPTMEYEIIQKELILETHHKLNKGAIRDSDDDDEFRRLQSETEEKRPVEEESLPRLPSGSVASVMASVPDLRKLEDLESHRMLGVTYRSWIIISIACLLAVTFCIALARFPKEPRFPTAQAKCLTGFEIEALSSPSTMITIDIPSDSDGPVVL